MEYPREKLLPSLRLCAVLTLVSAAPAWAGPIVIDTLRWTPTASPSSGMFSQSDGWTQRANNTPTRQSNASGSLISDFELLGDFMFNGTFSPIVDRRANSSCDQSPKAICNDNDILGVVFGWQNENNHYRLGFGQGGDLAVADVTGRQGLFLVREVGGNSDTLFSWDTSYWVDDASYEFSIERNAEALSVSVEGLMRSSPGSQSASKAPVSDDTATRQERETTVIDTAFLNGRVGVYTESQASRFDSLAVNGTARVPAPPPVLLMLTVIALLWRRRGAQR